MKWPYQIKHKIKAVAGLAAIISIILVGNFFLREKISTLDKSMSSICNDRLKPSVYIFEITDNMYRKRLSIRDKDNNVQTAKYIGECNHSIDGLIRSYEQTVLTKEEKQQWTAFRKHLLVYNHLEEKYLSGTSGPADHPALEAELVLVLDNLNRLSKIQIGEGNELRQKSRTILNSSLTFSTLEIALLIVLGLFTSVILNVSDRAVFNNIQKHSLN